MLTIPSVRVSDEGSYFCNVTFDDNTYPNVSMTANLTVQREFTSLCVCYNFFLPPSSLPSTNNSQS